MSLNRYHNSRSSDNIFKLLHEEESYLDILKGNVKAVYKDEIGETGSSHDNVRQELLQEEALIKEEDPGVAAVEDADTKDTKEEDEGTPEEQEKAVTDDAVPEGKQTDKEQGVKETMGLVGKGAQKSMLAARRARIAGLMAKKGATPASIRKALTRTQRKSAVGLG